jgi:hypothetical protein
MEPHLDPVANAALYSSPSRLYAELIAELFVEGNLPTRAYRRSHLRLQYLLRAQIDTRTMNAC